MNRSTELILLGATVVLASLLIVVTLILTNTGRGLFDDGAKGVASASKAFSPVNYSKYSGNEITGGQVISLINSVWRNSMRTNVGSNGDTGILVANSDLVWVLYDYHLGVMDDLLNTKSTIRSNFPELSVGGKRLSCIYEDPTSVNFYTFGKDQTPDENFSESQELGYRLETRPNEPGYVKPSGKYRVEVLSDSDDRDRLVICLEV